MTKNLRAAETHFEFGQNWSDYASRIEEDEIQQAIVGLKKIVPEEHIKGATFLDIGSGSGLHSLAAARLGAKEITSIDIDADSVATTKRVLARYGVEARVERMSVFETGSLGQFDIVYSWGVLHHTGDMWAAVRNAANHVRPGGLFAIALYQKTPMCEAWKVEKKLYTAAPNFVRATARAIFCAGFVTSITLRGQNPVRYIRDYKQQRGMSFTHDVHDWMGGYPYESSTPKETVDFVEGLGFKRVHNTDLNPKTGFFGTGCAEYLFRRN
jgi:2-polyprenyl-3-methyl-5-hydroxy-6-metoxy-1,4-benzoquinol methylase